MHHRLLQTIEVLSDPEEVRLLLIGLEQHRTGKMKSLDEIERSLESS